MNGRLLLCSGVLGMAALVGPVWARAKTDNSISRTIDLTSNVTVAGKNLQQGEYRLVVSGNEAQFVQHGKVVAEVPCTLKDLPQKSTQDSSNIDSGALTEITFAGMKQAVDF